MAVNLACVAWFCKLTVIFVFTCNAAYADSAVNRMQSAIAKHMTIDALQDIERDDWEAARDKVAASKDPLASKIFNWLLLLNIDQKNWTPIMFSRLTHFVRHNESWPEVSRMKVTIEGVMPEDLPHEDVLSWYNDFPPKTPYGLRRYLDALLEAGQEKRARSVLIDRWSDPQISLSQQKNIFKKYGDLLPLEAHKKRFDVLLHNGLYRNALEIADVLGSGYPELAKARIALAKGRNSGLGDLIDAVPEELQNDPGLLYERLRWRRKRDFDDGALEILTLTPHASVIVNPDEWWIERHIMIRRLLNVQDYARAYELANNHIQTEGVSYAQAQWLAGWLALYFMDRPTEAYERFSVLFSKVKTPISKARAAFWAGRSAEALGQKKLSRRWYKNAAEFQTTFYGQLAASTLAMKERLPGDKLPYLSLADRKRYKKTELIQAANLFRDVRKDRRSMQFIDAFLHENEEAKAYRFVAEVLAEQGNYHGAVRVAKKATRKGLFLTKQSYPTITKHLSGIDTAEWALIHAIIRQESIFDPKARSHAGALGLMQLMPATARETARRIGIRYSKAWLLDRPKYNITLGARYISHLISYYDGNYPLAIAAYNAGPGRVDQWIKTYGDPRHSEISLIDWIELIPIYETRNYVQRVLENVYVYRLRLRNVQRESEGNLYAAFQ